MKEIALSISVYDPSSGVETPRDILSFCHELKLVAMVMEELA
jgi:hypothetical protein